MAKNIQEFGEFIPDADYTLRPGGYLIVQNAQGRIAILSTPKGFFLPGGGQDGDESPEQTAVREAIEECGLQVHLNEPLGIADELVLAVSEGKYYRKRCAFFSAELVRREEGGEADHQLLWLSAEEAAACLSHKSQAWAVREANRIRRK